MTEATPKQRLWAAILSGSVGFLLAYVVGTRQPGLQVPPAIGYLAAGAFGAAGLTLLLQSRGYTRAATASALLVVAAMVGLGAWIGFGPGGRRCEASLGDLPVVSGELVCRAAFGTGALLGGLIAVLMLRSILELPVRRKGP